MLLVGWMAWPALFGAVALQLLVFTPLGIEDGGNRNWIQIAGFSLQPSEFLKLALALWVAYVLLRKHAMLGTWQRADVGKHHPRGFEAAMRSIPARAIVMPGSTDLYFPQADSEREVKLLQHGELRPLVSDLGHVAGRPGIRDAETAQIAGAVRELLGS